jgi:hypothetical protein
MFPVRYELNCYILFRRNTLALKPRCNKRSAYTERPTSSERKPDFETRTCLGESRDSSVGIATGYELEDREVGVRVPVGSRIFSSPLLGSGTHPGSYSMSTGAFPRG